MHDVPRDEMHLSAHEVTRGSSPSFRVVLASGEVRAGIELVLPAKDDSTSISGVVLDVDATPLAKATLSLSHSAGDGGGSGQQWADEQGRFYIRGRAGSIFQISASHPRGEAGTATLVNVPAGTHGIVLELEPIALATVRVTNTRGDPVTRFAFVVSMQLEHRRTTPTKSKFADRENGECRLPQPDADFWVEVTAPGFVTTEIGPIRPTPNPGLIEMRLEPLRALRGVVVRGDEPVVGAIVRAQRALSRLDVREADGFRLDAEPCGICPTTKTESDGSFTIHMGRAGTWRLRAEADGDVSALSSPIEVAAWSERPDARIDLAPRGSIRGRVLTESGAALAKRRIAVSAGDGDHREVGTDADGAYSFEGLAPGGYQVRLRAGVDRFESLGTSHTITEHDAPPIEWDCHVVDGLSTKHDIVVPDPVQLLVRIDADESFVPSRAWEVSATSKASGRPTTTVRATKSGEHFVLVLPHGGSWDTVATVESAVTQLFVAHVLEVTAGPVTKLHVLTVSKGSIRGLVAAGTEGMSVSLAGLTSAGDWVTSTTTLSANGTFEFPFAFDGTMEFDAEGAREKRRRVTIVGEIVNDVGEL